MSMQVGTRISGGPYNEGVGIVTKYTPGGSGCFIIGSGMQPVSGYVDIVWPTHEAKHVPAEIVTSLPYRIHQGLGTADDIARLRAEAAIHQATAAAKATEDQAARLVLRDRLLAEYPYLARPESVKGGSLVCAAKNCRTLLKRAFPGVQFSVTTERYSGGNSLSVRWTDGPGTKAVDDIVKRFAGGHFDGMTDCYEYGHSVFCDLFGDAKYVNASRSHSRARLAAVCAATFPERVPEIIAKEFNNGRLEHWDSVALRQALGDV